MQELRFTQTREDAARTIQRRVRKTQAGAERQLVALDLREHMKALIAHAENKHSATVNAHAKALETAMQTASIEQEAAVAEIKSEQALEFSEREAATVESLKLSLAEAHSAKVRTASERDKAARTIQRALHYEKRARTDKTAVARELLMHMKSLVLRLKEKHAF